MVLREEEEVVALPKNVVDILIKTGLSSGVKVLEFPIYSYFKLSTGENTQEWLLPGFTIDRDDVDLESFLSLNIFPALIYHDHFLTLFVYPSEKTIENLIRLVMDNNFVTLSWYLIKETRLPHGDLGKFAYSIELFESEFDPITAIDVAYGRKVLDEVGQSDGAKDYFLKAKFAYNMHGFETDLELVDIDPANIVTFSSEGSIELEETIVDNSNFTLAGSMQAIQEPLFDLEEDLDLFGDIAFVDDIIDVPEEEE